MVASLDPRWLQGEFSTLVGLFDRLVLWTNDSKTFRMFCLLCQEAGTQSEAVYRRQMTGERPSYQERQRVQVQCRECRKEMVDGSMAGHMTTQPGRATEERWSWTTSATGEELGTYRMAFPSKGGPRSFLVEGCPGRAAMRTAMWIHFMHRHIQNTVVILE